jgi:hypothetical protein|tara:strand:+ start:374 stop:1045 length:672 start_codon:yes stop_codon:yes gene_type:complete
MSFEIQKYLSKNATEITIKIGWDIGDRTNPGYTATVHTQDADCNWGDPETIILDENILGLSEIVGYFSTKYLPQEFHDLERWEFYPDEIAKIQIPVECLAEPDPEPEPKPKITAQTLSPANALWNYALWNDCDHLCVDVPDGISTISCKLSDGRQITFGFTPYELNGIPKCIDIRDTGNPLEESLGTNSKQYRQVCNGFSGGGTAFRSSKIEKPITLLSLIIH